MSSGPAQPPDFTKSARAPPSVRRQNRQSGQPRPSREHRLSQHGEKTIQSRSTQRSGDAFRRPPESTLARTRRRGPFRLPAERRAHGSPHRPGCQWIVDTEYLQSSVEPASWADLPTWLGSPPSLANRSMTGGAVARQNHLADPGIPRRHWLPENWRSKEATFFINRAICDPGGRTGDKRHGRYAVFARNSDKGSAKIVRVNRMSHHRGITRHSTRQSGWRGKVGRTRLVPLSFLEFESN